MLDFSRPTAWVNRHLMWPMVTKKFHRRGRITRVFARATREPGLAKDRHRYCLLERRGRIPTTRTLTSKKLALEDR